MIEAQPGLFINPDTIEQLTVLGTGATLEVAVRFTSNSYTALRGAAAEALLTDRGIPIPIEEP